MGNSFTVRISNQTKADITKFNVKCDNDPDIISSFKFDCVGAGKSCEFKIVEGNNVAEKAAMGAVGILLSPFIIPWALLSKKSPAHKVEVVVAFQGGKKDVFNIFLDSGDNDFEKFEKLNVIHDVTMKNIKNGIVITFKSTKEQIENEHAEVLKEQGYDLIFLEDFTEAENKFNEALARASEEDTIKSVELCVELLENTMDKKAQQISKQGLQLLEEHKHAEAIMKFTESRKFAKKSDTINLIESYIVRTLERKDSQEKSEELNKEAEELLSQYLYDEALEKFEEALTFVKENNFKDLITSNVNRTVEAKASEEKSEEIIKEAEAFLATEHYDEALMKLEEALKYAARNKTEVNDRINLVCDVQKNEGTSAEMIKRAQALVANEDYHEALLKFNEALKFARRSDTKALVIDNISATRDIKNNQEKCEEMIKEAEALLISEVYGEALKKFNEALKHARRSDTEVLVNNKIELVRDFKKNQDKCEESIKEAEALLVNEDYDEALLKFRESLKYVRREKIKGSVNDRINLIYDMKKCEEKSEEIIKEAETLFFTEYYDEALMKFNEALEFARRNDTKTLITSKIGLVSTTKKNQEKSEEIVKEAEALLINKQEHAAFTKFIEALEYVRKSTTEALIKDKISLIREFKEEQEKLEKLIEEAKILQNNHHNIEALSKLTEALLISKDKDTIIWIRRQIITMQEPKDRVNKAKQLNEEGLLLEHEEAIEKFNEALQYADDDVLKQRINMNKAAAINRHGEDILAEAWIAEQTENSEDAAQKFEQARDLFKRANSVCASDKSVNNLKIVDTKIKGNKCFNVAVKFESESNDLFTDVKSSEICEKLNEKCSKAGKYYKMARNKFEEGVKLGEMKFKFGIEQALKAIDRMQIMLKKVEKVAFGFSINKLNSVTVNQDQDNVEYQCKANRQYRFNY